ncbi:MAG: hypothetical protein GY772_23575 [bacterium]|nr:hypothetical protein [bacterium]
MDFDIDGARLEMVVEAIVENAQLEQVVRAICDASDDVGAVGPGAAHPSTQPSEDGDGAAGDAFHMTLEGGVECFDLTAADGSIPTTVPSEDLDPTTAGPGTSEVLQSAPVVPAVVSTDAVAAGDGNAHLGSCDRSDAVATIAAEGPCAADPLCSHIAVGGVGAQDPQEPEPDVKGLHSGECMQPHRSQASPATLNHALIQKFVMEEMNSIGVASLYDIADHLIAAIVRTNASSHTSVVITHVTQQQANEWRGAMASSGYLPQAALQGLFQRAAEPPPQCVVADAQAEAVAGSGNTGVADKAPGSPSGKPRRGNRRTRQAGSSTQPPGGTSAQPSTLPQDVHTASAAGSLAPTAPTSTTSPTGVRASGDATKALTASVPGSAAVGCAASSASVPAGTVPCEALGGRAGDWPLGKSSGPTDIPVTEVVGARLGAPDASELLLRICGDCSDPGWWVKTPIPQPRDCGSDLYVDHNCSGDRDGCDIAVVNDVVAVAASLNISLSPEFPGSAEGENASRALSRLLRHTAPHRRDTRSGPPLAMDTGGGGYPR